MQQQALVVLIADILFMSCCLDAWVITVNTWASDLSNSACRRWPPVLVVSATSSRTSPLQARWLWPQAAASSAGKVAGARWTGAKTTFDEDEAQPEAAAAQDTASPQEYRSLPASLKAVKWKKLVTAELQQVTHQHHFVAGVHCHVPESEVAASAGCSTA